MKFLAALIIFHSNDGGHYVAKKTDRARVKLTAIRRLHADLAMIVRRGCQHELHGFELIDRTGNRLVDHYAVPAQ